MLDIYNNFKNVVSEDFLKNRLDFYKSKQEDFLLKVLNKEIDINKLRFNKDNRTSAEYGNKIHRGWFYEDIIKEWFKNRLYKLDSNYIIELSGSDNDRIITDNKKKITTLPDINIKTDNFELNVELQISEKNRDKLGYDHKLSKIKRYIKSNNTFILWIIIEDKQFFILNPNEIYEKIIPSKSFMYGGKEVFSVRIDGRIQIIKYNLREPFPLSLYNMFGIKKKIILRKKNNFLLGTFFESLFD